MQRAGVTLVVTAVAVVLLIPWATAAQTTTADGVAAIVNGDYERAARILKPVADDTSKSDPLAQFFLAMLYASGNGVLRRSDSGLRAVSESCHAIESFDDRLTRSRACHSGPRWPRDRRVVQRSRGIPL